MPRPRVLLVGITVVALVAAVVLVVLNRRGDDSPGEVGQPSPPSLLAVDDHGAIVRDTELRGYGSDNVLRWKVPDTGGWAICATRCPDAILTGSLDAMNSPLIQTTTRPQGHQEITLPADHQVWAPARLGTATLVIRSNRQGRTELTTLTPQGTSTPVRLESIHFGWSGEATAPGLLSTEQGSTTWSRTITVRRGTPVIGPRVAVEETGCAATDGRALVVINKRITALTPAGKPLPITFDLTPDELGACAITSSGFVISHLTLLEDGTRRSQVHFFDTKGRRARMLELTEEAIPLASPTTPLVILSTPTTTTVHNSSGTQTHRFDNTSSAQFTPTGRLVLLTPQFHLQWTDL